MIKKYELNNRLDELEERIRHNEEDIESLKKEKIILERYLGIELIKKDYLGEISRHDKGFDIPNSYYQKKEKPIEEKVNDFEKGINEFKMFFSDQIDKIRHEMKND